MLSNQIPEKVKHIARLIEQHGGQSFVVGGAVRDILMGRNPKDWDICTDLPVDKLKVAFKGQHILEIGEAFGIIAIIIDGKTFEIAQMRQDVGGNGRHPDKVIATSNIEIDLGRRDFAMNAMAININDGSLIDPFCGQFDIDHNTISFVGNAGERIVEDKLRILRAFRFMSQLGFTIDENSMLAISLADNLNGVSQERITQEFTKIVAGDNAFETIKLMAEWGWLDVIIPEFTDLRIDHNNNWHLEDMEPFGNQIISHVLYVFQEACYRSMGLNNEDKLILRMAALLHDIAKPKCRQPKKGDPTQSSYLHHDVDGAAMTVNILERMKYPNIVIDRVAHLVRFHMICHDISKIRKTYKIRRLLATKDLDLIVMLGVCDTIGSKHNGAYNDASELKDWIELYTHKYGRELPKALVTGDHLIDMGFKPGPDFKHRLEKTFNYQINGCEDRKKLLAYAKGLIL